MQEQLRVVALIPAYNEEASIGQSIEAMLEQERRPDQIVVIPNGCTDRTAEVARQYPVTVLELPPLEHKKSEAINRAWRAYAQDADLVISLDADTVLPSNAVRDWEQEFLADAQREPTPKVGPLVGSTAKFTLLGKGFLTRLQRVEYSTCIDQALSRGHASVLAGAGCAISGQALRDLAERPDRPDGPWCYDSMVEDYELTYRLREAGGHTHISPTVRAYTDPMKSQRALYAQRMKWSTGMLQDLTRFGLNRLTYPEWIQVFMIFAGNMVRLLWLALMVTFALLGQLTFSWVWWLVLPAVFVAVQVRYTLRVPHRDRWDLAYAFMIWPAEAFTWMRMRWSFASLYSVLLSGPVRRLLRRAKHDRWAMQHKAEAFGATVRDKVVQGLGRTAALTATAFTVVLLLGATGTPGVPNVGAALGLELPEPQVAAATSPYTTHAPPAGYVPPTACKGYVGLTYDDGPSDATSAVVDTLNAYDMHATFFLLGRAVERDPAGARYLVEQGQAVEAHSMTHAELSNRQVEGEPGAEAYGVGHRLTDDELAHEIKGSADVVQAATGVRPTLFRPPYGYTDKRVSQRIIDLGLVQSLWTLDSNDWQGKTPEEIAATFADAKDGDVVLMHDDDQNDVDAIPLIAQALTANGLCSGRLVTSDKSVETAVFDPNTDKPVRENVAVVKP